MSVNQTSRYFKYALGEIILVVIGILIALQINNWNEQRKSKQSEIVLLKKVKEENLLNIKAIEEYVELRKEMPKNVETFITHLNQEDLESKKEKTEVLLANILPTIAYNFIQSSLKNYVTQYNSDSSFLTKELAQLEYYQNELELSTTESLDYKIKYVFEALENDVDLLKMEIHSFKTLNSLGFKNKMVMVSSIEHEISETFSKTYKQMQKVDSLVTVKLKQ